MENMEDFDKDLQAVMGSRYEDGETAKQMPVMEHKLTGTQAKPAKIMEKTPCPFPKPAPGLMDRLTNAALWAGICGGISMLLWWFEINGLMAMEAAFPCIVVCALLAGFGVGSNIK